MISRVGCKEMVRGLAQSPKTENGVNINLYKKFSEEERSTFRQMLGELRNAWQREELFFCVNANYEDIEDRACELPRSLRGTKLSFEEHCEFVIFQVGRFFANYLSSVRMYLDHMEGRLKRTFGHDSDEFRQFKNMCKQEYDNVFEYRLFYNLRNYSQHCGNPINDGRMVEQLLPDGSVSHEFRPGMNLAAFSKSFGWPKRIGDDLKTVHDPVDFCQSIATHINCIQRIHTSVVSLFRDKDRTSIEYFRKILRERPDPGLDVYLFECRDVEALRTGGTFQMSAVPSFQVMFLEHIHKYGG